MLINEAFQLFMLDKKAACSDKTLVFYNENLQKFFDFLVLKLEKLDIDASDLSVELLREYVLFLRQQQAYSDHPLHAPQDRRIKNTSVNTYFRAVRTFVNWLQEEEIVSGINVRRVKLPRSDADLVSPLYQSEVDQIDSLFDVITEKSYRNLCIVHLMLDAGLRLGEVINLRFCDCDFNRNLLLILGKGSKWRAVVLCPRLKLYLLDYIDTFRFKAGLKDRLFVQLRDHSKPLSENCIKQLFADIRKQTGIDRLHPHLLRHTFATSYIMGGGNLEYLRIMLGHYDYSITQKYLHLGTQYTMLKADIYKLDPAFFENGY